MASFIFPKVKVSDPKRSKRDLSSQVLTSFASGPIYPIKTWDILPGDDFEIRLTASIESFPMVVPSIGEWKASFDFYFEPWSNLYGFMDNNTRCSTKEVLEMPRWTFGFGSDFIATSDRRAPSYSLLRDNVNVASSIFDYLGVPVGYFGEVTRREVDEGGDQPEEYFDVSSTQHPAENLLAYIDVIRNYYVNNQESESLRMGQTTVDGDSRFDVISLSTMDTVFSCLRYCKRPFDLFDRADDDMWLGELSEDQARLCSEFFDSIRRCCKSRLGGLHLRTYKMDLNRGLMNSDIGDYKSVVEVARDGEGGAEAISVTALQYASKLQNLINRMDITGGRFSDWISTRWGVKPPKYVDRPIYLGSFSQVVGQRDVVATAAGQSGDSDSSNPNSQLGQQAGFTVGAFNKTKNAIRCKSSEYGTLICVFSMVPYVTYSQGFELKNLKTTFADVYDPAMSRLGYQDVSRFELSALPEIVAGAMDGTSSNSAIFFRDSTLIRQSVGKRVAWAEYMAELNRAHGQFAFGESMDNWAFGRVYTGPISESVSYSNLERYGQFDASTYVKPALWNRLFADEDPLAENFRLRVYFDVEAWRPIGKRLMPSL